MERDIEFNKRLMREKCGVEYDESLARLSVGCPNLDSRWLRLKNRLDEKEVEEIESRWAAESKDDLLTFENRFRNGEIEIQKLPNLTISAFTEEGQNRENNQNVLAETFGESIPLAKEEFLAHTGKSGDTQRSGSDPFVEHIEG